MDGSVLKPELDNVEQSPVTPPRPEHQGRDGFRSGTGGRSSSGGLPKMNGQNGAQPAEKAPTPANAEPRASGSGVHPQPRSGTPHAASACAGPPEHQVRDDARSGSSTGSSGGPLKMLEMNAWNGPHGHPAKKAPPSVNAEPNAKGSGAHPQPRSGTPHAASMPSTSSTRAGSSARTSGPYVLSLSSST